MSHVPYAEVPIIHQGLRQEETVIQITLALDYLEKVSCGIFQHIKSSVEKQKVQLSKLQDRSKLINKKMDKLAGTNKATKVFASAKYPGSDIPRDYTLDILSTPLPKLDRTSVQISSKHPPFDPDSIKDKCQHFHIKTSTKQIKKNIEVTPEEGLGSLPADLDSVSALLLFNTSENLYKKYVMLDPLGVVTKTRQVLEDEIKGDLDAAPRSMCQEVVEFKIGENYFYSPTLQEVPQLDVPLDLPDLPAPVRHDYVLNGSTLERLEKVRDLGATMTPSLNPQEHIAHITAKASSLLRFIFRSTRNLNSPLTLITLYKSLPRGEVVVQLWAEVREASPSKLKPFLLDLLQILHLCYDQLATTDTQAYLGSLPATPPRLTMWRSPSTFYLYYSDVIILLNKLVNGFIDCPNILKCIDITTPRGTRSKTIFSRRFLPAYYSYNSGICRLLKAGSTLAAQLDFLL
ncbi:WASH complex subunit 1-like [Macrosteles quadrilineatus]|uniref:WASH complex subunit 1-like n=1 Tax=Macrosteles quadrilineatus TaxID=74068 RepID=UPI0023E16969|nr:WASH complex subunit 1-like [Macrosteles quadrilineatus]